MKKVLMDSGPMVALFNAHDQYHKKAVDFLKNNRFSYLTTLASVTEVEYLLEPNKKAQTDFLTWISRGAVTLRNIGPEEISAIIGLSKKYEDVPIDFADACLLAVAETDRITDIATIDSDFSIYRINRYKLLKNIFPV